MTAQLEDLISLSPHPFRVRALRLRLRSVMRCAESQPIIHIVRRTNIIEAEDGPLQRDICPDDNEDADCAWGRVDPNLLGKTMKSSRGAQPNSISCRASVSRSGLSVIDVASMKGVSLFAAVAQFHPLQCSTGAMVHHSQMPDAQQHITTFSFRDLESARSGVPDRSASCTATHSVQGDRERRRINFA